MGSIDHHLARSVFDAALEVRAGEREAFVRDRCGGDALLADHVLRLLSATESATDFLEKPAIQAAVPAAEAYVGKRVGRYRLTALLGWGGMGRVYEAVRDDEPASAGGKEGGGRGGQTVALKIISALPSPEARRRFKYECELLGRLNHPGIARIYESFSHADPLTGEELPCFAMELIAGGQPITQHAAGRSLPLIERLLLFVQACGAVHHAHQRGVIHRDLKPANLLVAAKGLVKVIDFGIARAMDRAADTIAATRVTVTGQLIGTVAYMSPEQCAGDAKDVDLRSDVYSLGVVLYELCAGVLPYEVGTSSAIEAARIVRDTPPARLRAIDGQVHSDLEAIVMKALAKRPEERYQSAEALADDVRKFVCGDPVSARPPSMLRQLRHAWRRHKRLALSGLAVFLTLCAGVLGTSIGLVRATAARNEAQAARTEALQRAKSSEQAADFLIRVLAGANPFQGTERMPFLEPESTLPPDENVATFAGLQGRSATASELLTFAAERLETSLASDPLAKARVQLTLGQILTRAGLLNEAGPPLARAYETRLKLLGEGDMETARAAEWLAYRGEQFNIGEPQVQLRREALDTRRRVQGEADPRTLRAAGSLSLTLARAGRADEGLALHAETMETLRRARPEGGSAAHASMMLEFEALRAALLLLKGDHAGSAAQATAVERELERGSRAASPLGAWTGYVLSSALINMERYDEAEGRARAAMADAEAVFGATNFAVLEYFGTLVAGALNGQGLHADAATVLERMASMSATMNGPTHHATCKLLGRVGFLLVKSGTRVPEAEAVLRFAARETRNFGEVWRAQYYEIYLAEALALQGRAAEGLALINALREERGGEKEPGDAIRTQGDLAEARCLIALGRRDDAERLLTRAINDMQRLGLNARAALLNDADDARKVVEGQPRVGGRR